MTNFDTFLLKEEAKVELLSPDRMFALIADMDKSTTTVHSTEDNNYAFIPARVELSTAWKDVHILVDIGRIPEYDKQIIPITTTTVLDRTVLCPVS